MQSNNNVMGKLGGESLLCWQLHCGLLTKSTQKSFELLDYQYASIHTCLHIFKNIVNVVKNINTSHMLGVCIFLFLLKLVLP